MTLKNILLIGAEGRLGKEIFLLAEKEGLVVQKIGSPRSSLPKDPLPFLSLTDLVLDVSTPMALTTNLEKCIRFKKPVVIGSTGHTKEQIEAIYKASETIPLFLSSNFSYGISLLKALLKQFPKGDYEIIETHHIHKKDCPSGTTIDLSKQLPHGAKITSYRKDQVVGEHKIILQLPYETLVLHHKALNRNVFAKGALRACHFLFKRPKGLYTTCV